MFTVLSLVVYSSVVIGGESDVSVDDIELGSDDNLDFDEGDLDDEPRPIEGNTGPSNEPQQQSEQQQDAQTNTPTRWFSFF